MHNVYPHTIYYSTNHRFDNRTERKCRFSHQRFNGDRRALTRFVRTHSSVLSVKRVRSLFTTKVPLPHPPPLSLSHSEHTHDAKPRQKLINDISLRAMSERHPRRLPGFLSEEDPGSFTSEKERERIQSEPWNTMVDTVNPACRFDFIAALTPGNAVASGRIVRVCSRVFSCILMALLVWLCYRLILLHFISHRVNKRATCDCKQVTSSDYVPLSLRRHC